MASTLTQLYVHCIFHTKKDFKIKKEDLNELYSYIGSIIKDLDSKPIKIGGTINHVHILVSLSKNITISDFMRRVKGGSSKWIKTKSIFYCYFSWQKGYAAFGVSSSVLGKTIRYIGNQENHHKKVTFEDEYKAFLRAYGIEYEERFLFND